MLESLLSNKRVQQTRRSAGLDWNHAARS